MINEYALDWIVYRTRAAEDMAWANRRAQVATALASRKNTDGRHNIRWSAVIPAASAGLVCLGTFTGLFG